MIRKENQLHKFTEDWEAMWEQKQEHQTPKKQRFAFLTFKDANSTHPHLNLPEFHSPPSPITQ